MLEPLNIQATLKTPEVSFNNQTGVFHLSGMSYPEYGREFYAPIIQWVDKYAEKPNEKTIVHIKYKYFNTSSAKSILTLLQKFNEIRLNGQDITINWYYEKNDEQMIQDGENYSSILNFPFNLIETMT